MVELSIVSIIILIVTLIVELVIILIVLNKGVKQLYRANFWKSECTKALKEKMDDSLKTILDVILLHPDTTEKIKDLIKNNNGSK